MATFYWFGQEYDGTATSGFNLSSTPGATYGSPEFLSEANCWGMTGNWRMLVPFGACGASGDGTQLDHTFDISGVFVTADRIPAKNDIVYFRALPHAEGSGLSGGPWPKSELLYGGISAAHGWFGATSGPSAGACGDNCAMIFVHGSYWGATAQGVLYDTFDGGSHGSSSEQQVNAGMTTPYPYMRFGELVNAAGASIGGGVGASPLGYDGGLHLWADEFYVQQNLFEFDNLPYDYGVDNDTVYAGRYPVGINKGHRRNTLRFTLMGTETRINRFYVDAAGRFQVRANFVDVLSCEGRNNKTGYVGMKNNRNTSLDFVYTGEIKDTLVVAGTHHDRFIHYPKFGATAAIPRAAVGPKFLRSSPGAIKLMGQHTTLNVYPWTMEFTGGSGMDTGESFIPNNPDYGVGVSGGCQVQLLSNGNAAVMGGDRTDHGTIKLHEVNPYHGVEYQTSTWHPGNAAMSGQTLDAFNCALQFDGGPTAGASDTINTLTIDAGLFYTFNHKSSLKILDGTLQSDAILDLRYSDILGTVEIAGHTGGTITSEGLFVASSNAVVKYPSGGNLSYKTPTAGATTAIAEGSGSISSSFGGGGKG